MPNAFLLQKLPDGASEWSDVEGAAYHFAQRLPNAKNVCKNDLVFFYRPTRAGTPDAGCVYACARVMAIEIAERSDVIAELDNYRRFPRPVALTAVGDPRTNRQHSLGPVSKSWVEVVLQLAGEVPVD